VNWTYPAVLHRPDVLAGPVAQKADAEHHGSGDCPAEQQSVLMRDCYPALRVEALPVHVLADCLEFRGAEPLLAVHCLPGLRGAVLLGRVLEGCCPERRVEAPQVWRCYFRLPASEAQVCQHCYWPVHRDAKHCSRVLPDLPLLHQAAHLDHFQAYPDAAHRLVPLPDYFRALLAALRCPGNCHHQARRLALLVVMAAPGLGALHALFLPAEA